MDKLVLLAIVSGNSSQMSVGVSDFLYSSDCVVKWAVWRLCCRNAPGSISFMLTPKINEGSRCFFFSSSSKLTLHFCVHDEALLNVNATFYWLRHAWWPMWRNTVQAEMSGRHSGYFSSLKPLSLFLHFYQWLFTVVLCGIFSRRTCSSLLISVNTVLGQCHTPAQSGWKRNLWHFLTCFDFHHLNTFVKQKVTLHQGYCLSSPCFVSQKICHPILSNLEHVSYSVGVAA